MRSAEGASTSDGGDVVVVLDGMEFHAFHGVHDYELERGARFVVDVEMRLPAPPRDALGATVDYSRVYAAVREVVTGRRFNLIESVASAVAAETMAVAPGVAEVRVRVHKPHAPLPGVVRDVYCQVVRTRSERD